ncbi:MAG: 4Fe-4S dicluster domain-containing protein [Rhodospirillales bacterium]|jgi:Fe-S-cluster-containing dehydrogenase component
MTDKWNMIVDVANCTNCSLCSIACQDEFVGNQFPGYAEEMPRRGKNWIEIKQKVRGQAPMIDVAYLPEMCQHCDDAPCIKAAENEAITKRPDGIVIIDPVKSKGQRHLVEACPYGAITWNEEKDIPQSWFFDAHLLDEGWKEPRGSQVCATNALVAKKVSDAEMQKIIEEEDLRELHPELKTKPRVWYKNLDRYQKCFIGGSISTEIEGVVDCIEGAVVTLSSNGQEVAKMETDYFGDFKFDGLAPEETSYTVEINAKDIGEKRIDVTLQAGDSPSISLGEIRL